METVIVARLKIFARATKSLTPHPIQNPASASVSRIEVLT